MQRDLQKLYRFAGQMLSKADVKVSAWSSDFDQDDFTRFHADHHYVVGKALGKWSLKRLSELTLLGVGTELAKSDFDSQRTCVDDFEPPQGFNMNLRKGMPWVILQFAKLVVLAAMVDLVRARRIKECATEYAVRSEPLKFFTQIARI